MPATLGSSEAHLHFHMTTDLPYAQGMLISFRIGCAKTLSKVIDYLRADHLIEKVLESRLQSGYKGPVKASAKLDKAARAEYKNILASIDSYDGDELGELIKRLDIRKPDGNEEVLPPVPFNLMQVTFLYLSISLEIHKMCEFHGLI